MTKKFTVAVLGCGSRGLTYSENMLMQGDKYEIVALCDINPDQIQKMKCILPLEEVSTCLDPAVFFEEKRAACVLRPQPEL